MNKKMITKLMSYLLTAAMIAGTYVCVGGSTVEAQAAVVTKNVNLNVSNSIAGIDSPDPSATGAWTGSKVYLGDKLWRVLDPDNASTGATGQAFLFSEEYLPDNSEGSIKRYHSTEEPITWENCQLRKDLNGTEGTFNNGGIYAAVFTNDIEKNAIITSRIDNPDHGSVSGGNPTDDKLFLLSLDEVQMSSYGFNTDQTRATSSYEAIGSVWWLRSPGDIAKRAATVYASGGIHPAGAIVNLSNIGFFARPGLNLDLSSVLFSSASGEDKSTSFTATTDSAATTWKLTLKDGNSTFAANRTDAGDLSAGTNVTVKVKDIGNKISSDYSQLSAMLVDSNNTVLAYGPISNDVSIGEKTFEIPSYLGTASKLYIFGEKLSGGNLTDYAGNMVDVTTKAPNPPTPTPSEDNHTNNDSSNNDNQPSGSKKNEDTYINPLTWNYPANQAGSLCLIEHQGPVCAAAFKAATPAGCTEAFSFNMLVRENGVLKTSYSRKTGKFTLNIPKEYQKPGRIFALLGMDKYGNVRIFTDEDLSDSSFTTTLDIEGYAFSLIYTDGATITGATPNQAEAGTGTGGNIYTVQEGDTLSQIASKLGVSRKHLIDQNHLANPDMLKIGQKLSH